MVTRLSSQGITRLNEGCGSVQNCAETVAYPLWGDAKEGKGRPPLEGASSLYLQTRLPPGCLLEKELRPDVGNPEIPAVVAAKILIRLTE